ncbi:MAG: hypothetical protein ACFHX7_06400 [Pseudomonadota bacterium]
MTIKRYGALLGCILYAAGAGAAPNCVDNTCAGAQTCTVGTSADDFCEIDAGTVAPLAEIEEISFTAVSLPLTVDRPIADNLFFDNVSVSAQTSFDYSAAPEAFHRITLDTTDTASETRTVSFGFGIYRPDDDNSVDRIEVISGTIRINGGASAALDLPSGPGFSSTLIKNLNTGSLSVGANIIVLDSKDDLDALSDPISLMLPRYPLPAESIDAVTIALVETYFGSPPSVGSGTALAGTSGLYNGALVSGSPLPVNAYQVVGLRAQDSVNDTEMVAIGLPVSDSDGDGIADVLDAFPNDPLDFLDTDNDGTGDLTDTDDDGDGTPDDLDVFPLDGSETVDTDGDGTGNNADTDDDGDGLPDAYETSKGLNPLISNVGQDSDGDGVNDIDEFNLGIDPSLTDSDGDGLSDGDELAAGLDPTTPDDAVIASQLVTPSTTVLRLAPGATATVSWDYNTSDGVAGLSGMVLRVHYDSTVLTWLNNDAPLGTGFVSRTVANDTSDFDRDPSTNAYIEFEWNDPQDAWPGTLPTILLTAQFSLKADGLTDPFDFTAIRLTNGAVPQRIEGSTVTRYRVSGEAIRVGLGDAVFSLDVTGDGEFDPFSDGVIINRFLLGYPVEDIATDAELTGATRTRQQIFDLLQQSRVF